MRPLVPVSVVVTCVVVLASCGGQPPRDAQERQSVRISVGASGCSPANLTAHPGLVTFRITNHRTRRTAFQVLSGDQLIGQLEALPGGITGDLTLDLAPGTYRTSCQLGVEQTGGVLTVGHIGTPLGLGQSPDLVTALANYRAYLESQAAQLASETAQLNGAIVTGDVQSARSLYAVAHQLYERVKPAADNFGTTQPAGLPNLDQELDSPAGSTGFHRVEYALWVENSTAGLQEVSQQLSDDVSDLEARIGTEDLHAVQVAGGLTDLLGDVTDRDLTGQEESFSHLDLVDVQGALDGVRQAFDDLHSGLARRDPTLAQTVDARINAAQSALAELGSGTSFVSYTELQPEQVRSLGQTFDSLADAVAQAPSALSNPESQ
jgi:iron uptake system component EfeO